MSLWLRRGNHPAASGLPSTWYAAAAPDGCILCFWIPAGKAPARPAAALMLGAGGGGCLVTLKLKGWPTAGSCTLYSACDGSKSSTAGLQQQGVHAQTSQQVT